MFSCVHWIDARLKRRVGRIPLLPKTAGDLGPCHGVGVARSFVRLLGHIGCSSAS
ncbi:hypothetical protein MINT15_23580 [Saccharomonospora viridis]|uniref:Uncharacterized protein n=1 Tax=Saccharomonospora viridis TaxID=1852 RepID=A0A837D785_9PSEU|nr:hypothetical protein MINT15_23580 [Saccharomonospora viridis]